MALFPSDLCTPMLYHTLENHWWSLRTLKTASPTLMFKRVKGCFVHLGYFKDCYDIGSPQKPTRLLRWTVRSGLSHRENDSYQGAPTSPCLTNIVCRQRLSPRRTRQINGMYVYPLCGWCDLWLEDASLKVGVAFMRKIVEAEGFVVHPKKQRSRDGMRKEVTGVVVNEKTSVDRETPEIFVHSCIRLSWIYQTEKHGGIQKMFWQVPRIMSFVQMATNMVNPACKSIRTVWSIVLRAFNAVS